jgi:hypothetical protein
VCNQVFELSSLQSSVRPFKCVLSSGSTFMRHTITRNKHEPKYIRLEQIKLSDNCVSIIAGRKFLYNQVKEIQLCQDFLKKEIIQANNNTLEPLPSVLFCLCLSGCGSTQEEREFNNEATFKSYRWS